MYLSNLEKGEHIFFNNSKIHLSKFSSVKLELKWIGNTELKLTTYKLIIARTKNQRSVDTFFEAHLSFRAESQ